MLQAIGRMAMTIGRIYASRPVITFITVIMNGSRHVATALEISFDRTRIVSNFCSFQTPAGQFVTRYRWGWWNS